MAERDSLLTTLAELGLASPETISEVQARQVIFGGDLQVCLLELLPLSESELLRALGHDAEYPTLDPGPIRAEMALSGQLRAADLHAVVESAENGELRLVSDASLTPEDIAEAGRILGEGVRVFLSSSIRLEEAFAYVDGASIEPRCSALLDRWGERLPQTDPPLDAVTVDAPRVIVESTRPPARGPEDPVLLPDIPKDDDSWGDRVTPPVPEAETLERARAAAAAVEDGATKEPAVALDAPEPQPPVGAIEAPGAPERGVSTSDQGGLRPMSAKMVTFTDPGATVETAPPPLDYEEVTASAAQDVVPAAASSRDFRRVYALAEAQQDLIGARTRDRVVDIVVHFASARFRSAMAFGVTSKEAKGLKSSGEGAPSKIVHGLTIPLDLPTCFKDARDMNTPRVARLRASGLEGGIARDLSRPAGVEVLLVPISVRDRAVLLLWADNDGKPIPPEAVGEVVGFCPQVSQALERVLLERKRKSRVVGASGASLAPSAWDHESAPQHEPPTIDETEVPRQSGASASGPPEQEAGTRDEPSTDDGHSVHPFSGAALLPNRSSLNPEPAPSPEKQSASENEDSSEILFDSVVDDTTSDEERTDDEWSDGRASSPLHPAPAAKRSLGNASRPMTDDADDGGPNDAPSSFPAEAPRTLKGFPSVQPPRLGSIPEEMRDVAPRTATKNAREGSIAPRKIVPLGTLKGFPSVTPPSDPSASTQLANEKSDPDPPSPEALRPAKLDPPPREPPTGETLLSRRDPSLFHEPFEKSHSSRPPRIEPIEESGPPRSRSYSDLVESLLSGDRNALEQLLRGGETAVGALIARFPGPTREPDSPQSTAEDCGPLLGALVKLGAKATPFLTVRTADEDKNVRRWATFVLGELPGKESARAIASRLLDDAVEVRRAALSSARRVRRDLLTRRTLRAFVEQTIRDTTLSVDHRNSAIEALSDIREHEAIPTLLQLLEEKDGSLRRSARWALCVLTRQDFGDDLDAWRAFWQQHRDEDRIEWLIASLDHDSRDIRRAAGDELCTMAGDSYGFDEDQSASARRDAQARFREWWSQARDELA